MQYSRRLLLVFLFSFALIPGAAQTEPEAANLEAPPDSLGDQKIRDIITASQDRRWTDVLRLTDGVAETDPAYLGLMNLRLSAMVQIRDYDGALVILKKMSENPENADIHDFNFGEIYFLKKDYAESIKRFERFLASEGNQNNALARYKLYLGYLLNKQTSNARALKATILPSISHPLYYYVQAAEAFDAGRDKEAREWLGSAASIYSTPMNVAFADTFKELGWLEPHEVTGFPILTQAQLKSLNEEYQPQAPLRPRHQRGSLFEKMLPDFGEGKDKKK